MKKVLVLGAGLVSRPLVRYLLEQPDFEVTVASRTVSKADHLVAGHPKGRTLQLLANETAKLEKLVGEHDLAISLLPAPLHPVVAEMIGDRFPYYHPGFFNGIFSWASTGGWLAPWTMGLYAHLWGIRVVMFLPMLGACAVFLLAILLLVYVKLTRRPQVGRSVA